MGRDMLRVKVFQVGGGEGEQSEEDFLLIIYSNHKYLILFHVCFNASPTFKHTIRYQSHQTKSP